MKAATSIFLTILALCSFFSLPAQASDNAIWWESAAQEAEQDGYRLIGTKALAELLDSDSNAVIVDVRADYEFEAGRIPGSDNLEFDLGDRTDMSPEKRAAFEEILGKDRERHVVIYCRSFR